MIYLTGAFQRVKWLVSESVQGFARVDGSAIEYG
jgi:hypothetical protein